MPSIKIRDIANIIVIIAVFLMIGLVLSNDANINPTIYKTPTEGYFRYHILGSILVKARQETRINFSIPGYANATISGNFNATGVSDTLIKVSIIAERDYAAWSEGKQVKTYYDSSQLTASSIDINLTFGKYVLLFDNSFSPQDKIVTGDISLAYPMS